jgi:hypothetical protein
MVGEPTIQTGILHGLGDGGMPIGDLADRLGLGRGQVSQAAAHLILRGFLERLERGTFRLTAAGREARDRGVTIDTGVTGPIRALRVPKRTTIRQRAWAAMRITRTFTVADITTAVARDGDGDVAENLRRYCNELAKDGYLVRARRRRPGTAPGSTGFAVFSLVRDTGPLAPVFSRKAGAIHDFNRRAG